MPPRWLLIAVIAVYSTTWVKLAISAELLNTLPVASNGWRPIVGTQLKPYVTIDPNQSQKQTISLTSNDQEHKYKNDKNKITSSVKGASGNQVHINHHGSTGHHPLVLSKNKQSITGKPAPRHPVLGKLHAHLAHGKRQYKPTSATPKPPPPPPLPREEIMAPAPSSAIGSYAYFNQGPLSIQNTQLGPKPFHSPGHVDFSNHFAFSNANNDIIIPQQSYQNYQKHPSQNELHPNFVFLNQNDDFTRNLVPPPPRYKPQGEKETILVKEPQKNVIPLNQNQPQNPQLVLGKHKDGQLPDNVILFNQYQQQVGPQGQPGYDFEITKEQFQEYHTTLAPTSYKTSTEAIDTTKYKSFSKPSQYTYEVTEEKEWADQFPGFKGVFPTAKPKYSIGPNTRYHFVNEGRPQNAQNAQNVQNVQNIQYIQQNPGRPGENIQQFIRQQEQNQQDQLQYVEEDTINQFLPTPFNPDSAFPTSPTQAEVSTIYSEVGKKNSYKVPTTTVYNLKEVATHFPIYSDKHPDTQINIPNEQKDIREYSTEVTTPQIEETTISYTKPTPETTFPTRNPPSRRPSQRRRRPKPQTSTTEQVTDDSINIYQHSNANDDQNDQNDPNDKNSSNLQNHQNSQDQNVETERPTNKPRRRRPIKYRTTDPTIEATTRASYSYRTRPTRPQTITEEVYVSKNHRHRPVYQEEDRTVRYGTIRDGSRDGTRDRDRDSARDSTRDGARDGTRDSSRDSSRDNTRDSTRDSSRNGARDGARDSARDRARDSARDDARDSTRDSLKESAKENIKNHRYRPIYQEEDRTVQYESSRNEEKESNNRYVTLGATENDNINIRYFEETTESNPNFKNEDNYRNEDPIEFIPSTEEATFETNPPIRLPTQKRKRIRFSTTTETLPSTNLNIPENELDYTTFPTNDDSSESATVREAFDFETEKDFTTLTTGLIGSTGSSSNSETNSPGSSYSSSSLSPSKASTTTLTTVSTTSSTETPTKTNRLRRPIKYDVQRPRFSVKDYRQRLNQYMSSTTDSSKNSQESTSSFPRIRYPTRLKITSTTNSEPDESTESIRQKYMTKDRRKHYTTESSESSTTEKYSRTSNPRVKPFGRYRSSTEPTSTSSTTTQKISIKPFSFSNLKRPQQLSLRNRIYNKKRNSTTTSTTTTELSTEEPIEITEQSEVTIPFELAESKLEVTTQIFDQFNNFNKYNTFNNFNDFKDFKDSKEEKLTPTTPKSVDIVRTKPTNDIPQEQLQEDPEEALSQLQRIQDLTSSAHKIYNTPGMFKSVSSPTSRRVPSYFTIATEDPILPIEAFFPNLNQKFKKK